MLRGPKAIFETLICSFQRRFRYMRSEVAGHASNHPGPNPMLPPPPPVLDYLQDIGQEEQVCNSAAQIRSGVAAYQMLHMLRAPWPVNLPHVVGFDVCFLAALCVVPAYSPVF